MEFDKLQFWSISNLNFAGYTISKNQVWNRPKMEFVELHFLKSIFQKSSADQMGEGSMPPILRPLRKQFVPGFEIYQGPLSQKWKQNESSCVNTSQTERDLEVKVIYKVLSFQTDELDSKLTIWESKNWKKNTNF